MNQTKKIYKYFPQPVFHYRLENFEKHNRELSNYIYNLNKEDPEGVSRSNQGGWHSKPFNLKEKEAALHIAYYIKTGEVTDEVQPHHDELSGYSKKPLSKDSMDTLKYKNIKDTTLIDSIDESSSCSICQTPIKELLDSDEEVIVLECGDYFCKDCIFQWLEKYQNKCPNCNKVLSQAGEPEPPRLTRDEILENNYYKAAFFILKYCNYYRQSQNINVRRLDQLNELFIQQGGMISMSDCKTILEF